MSYQSIPSEDGTPLLRERGTVDVVDEGAGIDELNGSRMSRRSRKGAALGLLVLALGAFSALSAFGGRSSGQTSGGDVASSMKLSTGKPGVLSTRIETARSMPKLSELSEEEVAVLFADFMTKFEKTYTNDDQKAMRMEIFRRNLKRIDELNAASSGVVYDVSVWTDMTKDEFKALQTSGKISDKAKEHARANTLSLKDDVDMTNCQACDRFPELEQYVTGDLPEMFDWRTYGAVTKVKNQAYCGSCWSFSTTGCLEGAWFLAGNDMTSLSEQQLVTCDTEWNQGCNGGWPSLSMIYINENGGIVPEDIYPYRKVYMDGATSHPPVCSDVVHDGNYAATLDIEVAVAAGSMDEDVMARWLVLNGPLSVAMDATGMDYYSDGIDMGEYCDPVEIDHAVLIVGFGEEDGVKYWLIKNSWAIWWGERGYYRIVRGVNACGVADEVTAIIVGDSTVS